MSIFEAVILGLIQGVTEFLPISSSGHLVIVQRFMGIGEGALTFDAVIHFGSLAAVVLALRSELYQMARGVFGGQGEEARAGRRLFVMVVIATLPLVVVGLFFRNLIDRTFSTIHMSIIMLYGTGAVLYLAERTMNRAAASPITAKKAPQAAFAVPQGQVTQQVPDEPAPVNLGAMASDTVAVAAEVKRPHILWMGIAQAISVLPGLSRSGATIGVGVMAGLDRERAARFSFLMSIPAIMGATILEMRQVFQVDAPATVRPDVLIVGTLAAAVSSYFAIVILLRFLKRGSLIGFAYYTWGIATVVLLLSVAIL